MDTEVQSSPPHENGSKIQESSSDPPDEVGILNGKDDSKTPTKTMIVRETRSRSRTPQTKKDKKNDDSVKTNLKKIDEAVNGHEEKKTRGSEKKQERVDDSLKNGDSGDRDDVDKKESKRSLRKHKEQEQSSDENGEPKDKEEAETAKSEESASVKNEAETVGSETPVVNSNSLKAEANVVEMDPLILAGDEADPELQFDENSDMDSGKGSPILARCKTRRSHTRNISTPKTPKSLTDSESGQNSVAPTPTPENLNDTSDSLNIEDISTTAEAGSDTIGLDNNMSVLYAEDISYLNSSRDKSLSETLRCLSARKTIRPLNDSYRLRAFKNNQNKTDLNLPYDHSQDLAARVNAVKRKRSASPENSKKFRPQPGLVSYLASPLTNFKNRFISDVSSTSPKLTGYKDNSHDLHEGVGYSEIVSEEQEKKNKCLVM